MNDGQFLFQRNDPIILYTFLLKSNYTVFRSIDERLCDFVFYIDHFLNKRISYRIPILIRNNNTNILNNCPSSFPPLVDLVGHRLVAAEDNPVAVDLVDNNLVVVDLVDNNLAVGVLVGSNLVVGSLVFALLTCFEEG